MTNANQRGVWASVLAASEMGVALYQALGFIEVAPLVVFVPAETLQPT